MKLTEIINDSKASKGVVFNPDWRCFAQKAKPALLLLPVLFSGSEILMVIRIIY